MGGGGGDILKHVLKIPLILNIAIWNVYNEKCAYHRVNS